MGSEKMKFIEADGRKFQICKYDAKTSLKISKLIISKIMPVMETFLPAFLSADDVSAVQEKLASKAEDTESLAGVLELISLEQISKALDLIEDEDLDKIIDKSLMHCYELLGAGAVQVLNKNGTYGVADVEDDMLLVLRLTAEAVLWSVGGFFDGSRWTSILGPLAASFKQNVQTSTSSYIRPL